MFEQLLGHGVQLITRCKTNMKNRLMSLSDKLLLRKRAIIESITDQLKSIAQIEHTRHRSPLDFCVNLICGLIAYCYQPEKPSLRLDLRQLEAVSDARQSTAVAPKNVCDDGLRHVRFAGTRLVGERGFSPRFATRPDKTCLSVCGNYYAALRLDRFSLLDVCGLFDASCGHTTR